MSRFTSWNEAKTNKKQGDYNPCFFVTIYLFFCIIARGFPYEYTTPFFIYAPNGEFLKKGLHLPKKCDTIIMVK